MDKDDELREMSRAGDREVMTEDEMSLFAGGDGG